MNNVIELNLTYDFKYKVSKTSLIKKEDLNHLIVNNYPIYTNDNIFLKYIKNDKNMNIEKEVQIFKNDIERYLSSIKLDLLISIDEINKVLNNII